MEPMQPPEPPQWRVLGVQAVTCWVDRIGSSPPHNGRCHIVSECIYSKLPVLMWV